MIETLLVLPKKPGRVDGFLGEVAGTSFITNSDLTSAVGITMGTQMNPNENWLRYAINEVDYYMAKRPFRHSLTWEHLDSFGAALGTKTVVIGGDTYKVRLMKCKHPTMNKPGLEWATFVYRVYAGASAGTNPDVLAEPRWASYSDTDLGLGTSPSNGMINIGQDAYNGGWAAPGYHSPAELWYQPPNTTNDGYGWRPLLELIL